MNDLSQTLLDFAAKWGSWLKVESFRPFTLIVDRDGRWRKHFFGKSTYEKLEAHIRPCL